MKREVRCLYKALLKTGKPPLDLRKIIAFYEEYENLRKRLIASEEAPHNLKWSMPAVKMPKYLVWAKQYLIKEEK